MRRLLVAVAVIATIVAWYGYRARARTRIYDLGGSIDGGVVILRRTSVTDEDLKLLKWAGRVNVLWLNETNISDAGLAHLKSLPHLQALFLDRTLMTDAGLQSLEGLPLKWLSVRNTAVTERSIAVFEHMPTLECLEVLGTPLRRFALPELKRRLPKCNIDNAYENCTVMPK